MATAQSRVIPFRQSPIAAPSRSRLTSVRLRRSLRLPCGAAGIAACLWSGGVAAQAPPVTVDERFVLAREDAFNRTVAFLSRILRGQ